MEENEKICITILLGNLKDRGCSRELNIDGKAVLNYIFYKPYVDICCGFNFSKIWG